MLGPTRVKILALDVLAGVLVTAGIVWSACPLRDSGTDPAPHLEYLMVLIAPVGAGGLAGYAQAVQADRSRRWPVSAVLVGTVCGAPMALVAVLVTTPVLPTSAPSASWAELGAALLFWWSFVAALLLVAGLTRDRREGDA